VNGIQLCIEVWNFVFRYEILYSDNKFCINCPAKKLFSWLQKYPVYG
jgi:hypothetical protein